MFTIVDSFASTTRRWRAVKRAKSSTGDRPSKRFGLNEDGNISSEWSSLFKSRTLVIVKVDRRHKQPFKKLPECKARLERHYPEIQVEVWSFDEHRLGIKPIIRKTWATVGQRLMVEVDHRYEWTYL